MANLEVIGDRAAADVYALMDHSMVTAANDGAGLYLSITLASTDEEWMIAGCPTLAADNEHARWYVSSGDGSFHADHPSFEHDADPEAVKQWIMEQVAGYEKQLA